MRRLLILSLGGLIVGLMMTALTTLPSEGVQERPRRLLFVNLSLGFRHDTTATAAEVVTRLGWRSNPRFYTTTTEDLDLINQWVLPRYDAIMFYTTGELPLSDEQKQVFLDFVRNGKGFVGVHSATDTWYKWPEFGELIGAYFLNHPWHEKVRLIVEDRDHPATRHLGETWEITDEIYQFRDPFSREKVRVLISLDNSSVDLTREGVQRADKDFAIAWCRQYGKGRSFYTALGHREEVWRDPKFQEHLLGGILWAMGVLPGDATPRPRPAK